MKSSYHPQTDRQSERVIGRFVEDLCFGSLRQLEWSVTTSWVHLQQQLPNEHTNGILWSFVWEEM